MGRAGIKKDVGNVRFSITFLVSRCQYSDLERAGTMVTKVTIVTRELDDAGQQLITILSLILILLPNKTK